MVQSLESIKQAAVQIPEKFKDNESKIAYLIDECNLPSINHKTQNIRPESFLDVNDYVKKGYFPFKNESGVTIYALNNLNNFILPEDAKIVLIKEKDLYVILEKNFSHFNMQKAKFYLETISKSMTAKNIDYKRKISLFLGGFIVCFFLFPGFFNLINNLIYLSQNVLKSFLFASSINSHPKIDQKPKELRKDVPIYTILVPLYKETQKAQSIVSAIDQLKYPKDKLDVKFIVEDDDQQMINALHNLDLPSYIQIIRVPYDEPRTKPKALNYAMNYVKGEYVTIYDAEDRPDPFQLLEVIDSFAKLPAEYACLQAKLNFYNANENILTKFFSIEYKLWFDFLLKALSGFKLPVTLGGTSNHFKVSALEKVGYWDAYNVTEDADLGLRLYLNGYRVQIIDSETLEEAPVHLNIWLLQRSRWIKGFVQTLLVLLLQNKDYKKVSAISIAIIYIFIGFSSYSFFVLPWLFLIFLVEVGDYIYYLWLVNSFFSLAYMYCVAYFALKSMGRFRLVDYLILLFWPFYFVLHTIASYRAIWELLVDPFRWNKTQHGLSKAE